MIPRELQDYSQWVCWKRVHRTRTKVPICPGTGKPASCTDSSTWGSYREAGAAAERLRLDGTGFVFTAGDPFTGIDLDHCRSVHGDLEPWARQIVQRLNSFTEWSPSGEGIHILVKASLPAIHGMRRRGIEIYTSSRYFTMTGRHLEDSPQSIEGRQAEILELAAKLDRKNVAGGDPPAPLIAIPQTDEQLIRRAQTAKNGAKFRKLWAGDTSAYDGDHSRADAALCALLAYHTNGDAKRIDRLFRFSGLYRPKWDRPTARSTYGWITIDAAITNRFFPNSSKGDFSPICKPSTL